MLDKSFDVLMDAMVSAKGNMASAMRKVLDGNPLLADNHEAIPLGRNVLLK